MSLDEGLVVVVTNEGMSDFRPSRLSWRDSRQFRISGLDRRFRQRQNTLRFRTEIDAKQAASAMIGLGGVSEQLARQPPVEIPAEIPSTVLLGPLFLGFIALELLTVVEVFVGSTILRWIFSFSFLILFFTIFSAILDRRLKAGPVVAWFRPRTAKAWLRVDEEDLVVRVSDRIEGYRPSKIEWVDSRSFTVTEGGTSFRLVFKGPDDAVKVASMIKSNLISVDEGISGLTSQ